MNKNKLNTIAVVLKRTNYKEADKILTVYTKDLGKISCIAKGIRKISSKKLGALEPFCLTKIHIVESYGYYIVTQTNIIKSFINIKSNYESITNGLYMLEIFDKIVPLESPNLTLFNFLSKSLYFYDLKPSLTIINGYNIKLLRLLGFYSEDIFVTQSQQELAKQLEKSKFEEILKLPDNQINFSIQAILRNYTEEVAESKIRSILN